LSPNSGFGDFGVPIAESLRPPPGLFPFYGDFGQRLGPICTAWAALQSFDCGLEPFVSEIQDCR